VAENRPRDVAVLELLGADLAREGAVALIEDVLGGDFDAAAEVLTCEEEVEGWRGDDDLCRLGIVSASRSGLCDVPRGRELEEVRAILRAECPLLGSEDYSELFLCFCGAVIAAIELVWTYRRWDQLWPRSGP